MKDFILSRNFLIIDAHSCDGSYWFDGPIMDGDARKIWNGKILDVNFWPVGPFLDNFNLLFLIILWLMKNGQWGFEIGKILEASPSNWSPTNQYLWWLNHGLTCLKWWFRTLAHHHHDASADSTTYDCSSVIMVFFNEIWYNSCANLWVETLEHMLEWI